MGEAKTALGSKYHHVRDIAEGGMGTVSLALREEGRFRRVYAVKRLLPEYRRDARVRAMFMEEARIAGLLHHLNAVSVVDVGEDIDGPYIVMDYVQGVSLGDLITNARTSNEVPSPQICARIIKDVAEGLHAAHELVSHDGTKLELVHRDVSPQNVIVGFDGTARLTDFGIAKALGRQEKTSTGILKGKFGYFAPERLRFQEPTRASDIFSLGVVLFELLTAQRLYAGEQQTEVARQILEGPIPDLGEAQPLAHPMMVELLFEMLAKEPSLRPKTAKAVAERLDAMLVDMVQEQGALSVAEYVTRRFSQERARQEHELDELTAGVMLHRISHPPPWFRRHRRGLGGVLIALAMAGLLGVWSWMGEQTQLETHPLTAAQKAPTLPSPAPPPNAQDVAPLLPSEAEPPEAPVVESPTVDPPATKRRTRKKTASQRATQEPPAAPSKTAKPTKSDRSKATKELWTWK